MRKLMYGHLSKILSVWQKTRLPSYSGNYFVEPQPPYISQFIGIYPSNITTETPLTNKKHMKQFGAKDSQEFTFWAWRDCGIACVKMILSAKGKAKKRTIMDLTHEGIKLGGYIVYENGKLVDKGWFHNSLVNLLKKYTIKSCTKKFQSAESIALDILKNRLVILSVLVPGRSHIQEDGSFESKDSHKPSGHLLLAYGVKMNDKTIQGFYVHDPRGLKKYQKNTYVPRFIFDQIFTNRTIVTD